MAKARMIGMLLGVAVLGFSASAAKAQLVVGQCMAGQQYSTIQAAVNAAPSGSVIKVCPGGYPEQIVIEKPLTLEGIISQGAEGALILPPATGFVANDGSSAAQVLVKNTSGVTISNLIVDAAAETGCFNLNVAGVFFHNASGTLNKSSVRNQAVGSGYCSGVGVFVLTDNQQPQTVTVENNDFRNIYYAPLFGNGQGLTINALNNYIAGPALVGTGTAAILYQPGVTGVIEGNTIANFVTNTKALVGGGAGIELICTAATVSGNTVVNAEIGILQYCSSESSQQGNSTITMNKIFESHQFDGIYVNAGANLITHNTIVGAGESGIHLDTTTGSVNNVVSGNTITETCAGILTTGTGKNLLSGNTFNALYIPTMNGTSCGPIF